MVNDLDMKVLRAVHIQTQSGSVSRTANIPGVTPGPVSYLINTARKAAGSALFFRSRRGMAPDPQAREFSARYQSICLEFQSEQSGSISNRPIAISTYTLVELLLSLAVDNSDENQPAILFHCQSDDENERLIKLRNRETDIDIGTRLPADKAITQLRFFAGNAGVLASRTHPTLRKAVTLKDWQTNRHADWRRGMHFIHDDFEHTQRFETLLRQKDVAYTSSTSLNLITLCLMSHTLVLVPEIVGRKLATLLPVNWFAAPDALQMRYECYIHYHRSRAANNDIKRPVALFHASFGP